jgi:hypothetical protein
MYAYHVKKPPIHTNNATAAGRRGRSHPISNLLVRKNCSYDGIEKASDGRLLNIKA